MNKYILIAFMLTGCSYNDSTSQAMLDCQYEQIKHNIQNESFLYICMQRKGFTYNFAENCQMNYPLAYCWDSYLASQVKQFTK